MTARFNPAPGWPPPPTVDWLPPPGWQPESSWPKIPRGWQVVVDPEADAATHSAKLAEAQAKRASDEAAKLAKAETKAVTKRERVEHRTARVAERARKVESW
jgi:hypothetical protein